MSTVTGPCEAVGFTVQADYARPPLLIHCGRPGVLRMQFLLPFGVIMCDECLAKKLEAKK